MTTTDVTTTDVTTPDAKTSYLHRPAAPRPVHHPNHLTDEGPSQMTRLLKLVHLRQPHPPSWSSHAHSERDHRRHLNDLDHAMQLQRRLVR